MKKALLLVMSVVLGSVLFGCQSSESEKEAAMQNITGTIAYRERVALPDNAVVTISLQDVSLMDVAADVISTTQFETNGAQVPFNFDIEYDGSKIKPGHTYSISARIEIDGKLRFITDTMNAVITDENNTQKVDLRLISVAGQ